MASPESNPPPPVWQEYLADSPDLLDNTDLERRIDNVAAPGDDSTRRQYFRSARYPYPLRMDLRTYMEQKYALQIELVKFQNWTLETGRKVLVLMEGRDAAGKGSTIKRMMEFLNPRYARVVALDKPSERERTQWYFQRYVDRLPAAGEIVFFDRSWYNRAGVERVMEFCTREQYAEFMTQAPLFERMLHADGITILKFYLSISKEEQAARFEERRSNPLKQWKLSPIDLEAQQRWDRYTEAEIATLSLTNSAEASWTIVKADDKLRARLETMRSLLSRFPYRGRLDEVVGAPDPWIVAPATEVFGDA
ncbi:MAG: polyphosphate kinase 2 [Phycisphaerales bacterium]|nr:polyphosphate kinase 2 [Phycisphaerales bacterium]